MPGDLHNHSTCSDGVGAHLPSGPHGGPGGAGHYGPVRPRHLSQPRPIATPTRPGGGPSDPAVELTATITSGSTGPPAVLLAPGLPQLRATATPCAAGATRCCLQSAREIEAMYPQFRTEQALEYAKDSGVFVQERHHAGFAGAGPVARGFTGSCITICSGGTPVGWCSTPPSTCRWRRSSRRPATKGVLIFAHPTVSRACRWLRQLVAEGKLDGIEIDHPRTARRTRPSAGPCARSTADRDGGHRFPRVPTWPIPIRWGPASRRTTRLPGSTTWRAGAKTMVEGGACRHHIEKERKGM